MMATRGRSTKKRPTRPPKSAPARTAMDDLALLSCEIMHLQNAIEVHRSAVVGALADRRRHDVPADDCGSFIDPVLESLSNLGEDVEGMARRLIDVGRRLHRVVPCR